eukprot:UN04526
MFGFLILHYVDLTNLKFRRSIYPNKFKIFVNEKVIFNEILIKCVKFILTVGVKL